MEEHSVANLGLGTSWIVPMLLHQKPWQVPWWCLRPRDFAKGLRYVGLIWFIFYV